MTLLQAHWDLTPTEQCVHRGRHVVAGVLTAWRVSGDDRDSALLVYAELATNALRYGKSKFISVHITLSEGELTVNVTDDNSLVEKVRSPRRADWDAETGRGLLLVAAVASEWGTYATPSGKGVWATVSAQVEGEDRPPPWILAPAVGMWSSGSSLRATAAQQRGPVE